MSLVEKLDGVLALAAPGSYGTAKAEALLFLRDHGPAIRQAMIDAERLREIAQLIGCIFAYGGFKAETFNERRLEVLLRENGTFWQSASEYEAANAAMRGQRPNRKDNPND